MYGVPANLDLRQFLGDYLTQLCIGQYDLQFIFGKGSSISVQGQWELRDAAGTLLDHDFVDQPAKRESYKAHFLLGATVTASQVNPPQSFTLFFDTGMMLTIFDDSKQHESFSIQPGDIFI
jgi:hypothetical protein